MTYEEFRDKINKVLLKNKDGLTWTQIRKKLRICQKVPYNRWVSQLERDIQLVRERKGKALIWRI